MGNEKDNLEFLLSRYLDGQLSPQEMERLEDRLGGDLELRLEMRRYARLDEILGEMRPAPELKEVDFDAQRHQIMAALERKALLVQRPRFNAIRLTFAGMGALAAAVAIAVGAWMFFHSTVTPHPQTGGFVSVAMYRPAASGRVEVAVVGPAPEDSAQAKVVVAYEQVPDDQFRLAPEEPQPEQARNAPPGTVVMFGVATKPEEQPGNSPADLLME